MQMLTFVIANSLDPVQDRLYVLYVGPDLDPNCLTLVMSVPERIFCIILKEVSKQKHGSEVAQW